MVKHIGFRLYHRSYFICSPVIAYSEASWASADRSRLVSYISLTLKTAVQY